MSTVVVRNGNVDGALRTMKQKNAKEGLLKTVKERTEGYMKPGVKRRKAKKEGIKNSRRRERMYN
jgi:ribosomal protein S21